MEDRGSPSREQVEKNKTKETPHNMRNGKDREEEIVDETLIAWPSTLKYQQ